VKLVVGGERFTATCRVELNGVPVPADRVRFVERKAVLKLRGTAAALGLVPGPNTVIVLDGDARSEPFAFRFDL